MPASVVPMLHVPDVSATVAWYESIGFTVVDTWREAPDDGGQLSWAQLAFGRGTVMLTGGGKPANGEPRDVSLYLYVDDVAEIASHLTGRVEVEEPLHDTFYGMRELIVRDLNGVSLTFGQQAAPRGDLP